MTRTLFALSVALLAQPIYPQIPNPAGLIPASDLTQTLRRSVQLMESTAAAVPGLVRASAPVHESARADLAKIDRYFDERVKANPSFEKAVKDGLSRNAFRSYYGLKASTAFSRGAHDEWNIIRTVNERRRNDPKYGIANQLPVLFDGLGIAPSGWEANVSDGYAGRCAP